MNGPSTGRPRAKSGPTDRPAPPDAARVRRLCSSEPAFDQALADLIAAPREDEQDVSIAVADIIAAIREEGFHALARYTERFDAHRINESNVRVSSDEIAAAHAACPESVTGALEFAARRIRSYHERQLPSDIRYTDDVGVTLGWRWNSVDAAGLYAPGGRAAYPSSVLMNAIPARVAGVPRLTMCTPTPNGELNPAVLVAASIAGVDDIFKVGGAQAIAALAYGCGPIPAVDVIVGPGNAFVAEAKRQVFGRVGIDAIAGPSEILVLADALNDPAAIAADLLSQAEHDPSSQSILITDDAAFADAVEAAAVDQMKVSPRREVAAAAWFDNSAIIIVDALENAAAIINRIAPEHLELAIASPEPLLARIRHAGAIFIGRRTPEAVGDYVAGPNHVLPTGQAARYASGLSVLNFMKRSSIIGCLAEGVAAIGPAAITLAEAEGLHSHAESVRRRLDP